MNRKTQVLSLRRTGEKMGNEGNGRAETEKGVIEELLRGAQQLTLTVFYVGCGATVLVWEGFEQLSKTLYKGVRPFWRRKGVEKPISFQKKKVLLFPIDHYDRLNVEQIVERLPRLSKTELALVKEHETTHRNRNGVVSAIARRLEEGR
jgi:hypothetical protein